MLKRKIAHVEEDVAKIKKENHRLIGELQRARNVRFCYNFTRKSGCAGPRPGDAQPHRPPEPGADAA